MTFTLTYAKNTAQCELFPGQKLRLWAVPTAYSDDGLVVAVWGSGELEPCPACLGTDMEMLAEYECRHDDGSDRVVEIFRTKEVKYA